MTGDNTPTSVVPPSAPTDTMAYVTWNPLDARSPIRSMRVQGAVVILLGLVGNLFNIPYLDEAHLNSLIEEGGTLLLAIGAIRAKVSARPF